MEHVPVLEAADNYSCGQPPPVVVVNRHGKLQSRNHAGFTTPMDTRMYKILGTITNSPSYWYFFLYIYICMLVATCDHPVPPASHPTPCLSAFLVSYIQLSPYIWSWPISWWKKIRYKQITMSKDLIRARPGAAAVSDRHVQHLERIHVNKRAVRSDAVYARHYTSVHLSLFIKSSSYSQIGRRRLSTLEYGRATSN